MSIRKLVRLLELLKQSETASVAARETLFSVYKTDVKKKFLSVVRQQLSVSHEIKNYPALLDHLLSVLESKLNDSEDFFKILNVAISAEGYLVVKGQVDFTPLGNYTDFITGKLAGGGNSSGTPKTARGWRSYYLKFRKNDDDEGDVYPRIVEKRLGVWASNSVAPYWYWYMNPVNTSFAYPYQDVRPVISLLTDYIRNLVAETNEDIEGASMELDIDMSKIDAFVDVYLTAAEAGTKARPDVVDFVDIKIYSGKYKGRVLNYSEVESLISSGEVKVASTGTRIDENHVRFNIHEAGTGRFTGLYVVKKV